MGCFTTKDENINAIRTMNRHNHVNARKPTGKLSHNVKEVLDYFQLTMNDYDYHGNITYPKKDVCRM